MRIQVIAPICFLFWTGSSHAQWTNLELMGGYGRGFLLPHRQNMKHLPNGAAQAFELTVSVEGDGSKPWHHDFKTLRTGLLFKAIDLSNHDILGYGFGLAAFVSGCVYQGPHIEWKADIGAGPGFITKKFDPVTNYKNVAIGSHGNAFITVGTSLLWHFSEDWSAEANLSFNHFSNAAFSLPNLGLNYPMFSIGISHRWKSSSTDSIGAESPASKRSSWQVGAVSGVKEYPLPYQSKGLSYAVWIEKHFHLLRNSSLSIGSDMMYNAALRQYRSAIGEPVSTVHNLQLGARLGYALHVGQAQLFLHQGIYLQNSYRADGHLYNRAGIRYGLTQSLAVHLALKSHLFKADYAELGIVYRI
jgi:hypothetical protein